MSEHGSDNCSDSDSDADSSKSPKAEVDDSPLQKCMDRNKQCKPTSMIVRLQSGFEQTRPTGEEMMIHLFVHPSTIEQSAQ